MEGWVDREGWEGEALGGWPPLLMLLLLLLLLLLPLLPLLPPCITAVLLLTVALLSVPPPMRPRARPPSGESSPSC